MNQLNSEKILPELAEINSNHYYTAYDLFQFRTDIH